MLPELAIARVSNLRDKGAVDVSVDNCSTSQSVINGQQVIVRSVGQWRFPEVVGTCMDNCDAVAGPLHR